MEALAFGSLSDGFLGMALPLLAAGFSLPSVSSLLSILSVAIGLGLVIFFHELGHFAVAKWCDVQVERFSIGFGPILLSWKWGETEYALSAVPFGGYVKMLGQDDADPSQLTSEEIAADPRSYSAKTVPQRMAIISAGVIMNLITGTLFCAIAFLIGRETFPAKVGMVVPGKPAWKAGLSRGDVITALDGSPVRNFEDVSLGVALSTADIELDVTRRDGSTFKTLITPDRSGTRPSIGVQWPASDLKLAKFIDKSRPVQPGSVAEAAEPQFQAEDRILAVDGETLSTFEEFQDRLAEKAGKDVVIRVRRGGEKPDELDIPVKPGYFRTLGLVPDAGPVAAIRRGGPAEKAGFQVGDKLARVAGKNIGTDLDPLRLNDEFSSKAGEEVEVLVIRQKEGGPQESLTLKVVPDKKLGWFEAPLQDTDPLSLSSIGLALPIIPIAVQVVPGGPADNAGITVGSSITKVEFVLPDGVTDSYPKSEDAAVTLVDGEKSFDRYAYAFWKMQNLALRDVKLTVVQNNETKKVLLKPEIDKSWPMTQRGLVPTPLPLIEKADGIGEAVVMAYEHTRRSVLNIYLTLRSLFTGFLSPKEFHGPVGIAMAAYNSASHGLPTLLLFLGFLSANLAVLNFLPIPLLDGGHMVFLIWEGVTRRKPSETVLIAATYVGLTFVISLMVFVICLDVFYHQFSLR